MNGFLIAILLISVAWQINAMMPAPSTCVAEVKAIRAAWAGRPAGYAEAVTPVTSAQV